MSKQNVFDIATDKLKSRMDGAMKQLHQNFKGTNPYRQEPISRPERLMQYEQFTPQVEQMMRQSIGDNAVDKYIVKMEAEKRKRYGQPEV